MTTDDSLAGKTALITGASGGLGERFAQVLSSAGARVILASRRLRKLQTLCEALDNACAVELDVSVRADVERVVTELTEAGEQIDICVNNAGIAVLTPIFDTDQSQQFDAMVQTNLLGVWYVTQSVANHMRTAGLAGSIINIASINGANKLRPGLAGYAASKAGVIQLTKALVGELSPAGIRINCICPGLFHTPLTDYKLHTSEQKQAMAETIPLGFVASPDDLDGALLLLASDSSRYMTGSCVTVDGGNSWGG